VPLFFKCQDCPTAMVQVKRKIRHMDLL
jgi:hypothetical protein